MMLAPAAVAISNAVRAEVLGGYGDRARQFAYLLYPKATDRDRV